jgi:hypothetical protein
MQRSSLYLFSVLSSVVLFAVACEPSSERESSRLSASSPSSSAQGTATSDATSSQEAQSNNSGAEQTSDTDTSGYEVADEVPYGSLKWTYGGISGRGYSASGVSISGLRISGRSLSFHYGTNLSAWGYSKDAIGGYACLFVQKEDGSWVGGKFDWISSSRSSRGLENVFGGYSGWTLSGVPNPCQAAFVILDASKKRRSNVIAGTWYR